MSFRQGKSSSEKRCKCTHKFCNEQIFFNIFFAKIMREKNRGKSVRIEGGASRTGRDGNNGSGGNNGRGGDYQNN